VKAVLRDRTFAGGASRLKTFEAAFNASGTFDKRQKKAGRFERPALIE